MVRVHVARPRARSATAGARRLLAGKQLMLGRMGEGLESVAGTDRKTVVTQCQPGRAVRSVEAAGWLIKQSRSALYAKATVTSQRRI